MYLGRNPAVGTQRMLDSIESQFNGVLTTFDLRYGGVPTYPTLSASLIVSLGGVLQEPGEAYYVSSDKIVFSEAPQAGTECWILLYSQYGTGVGAAQNGTLGAETLVLTGQLHGPANFVIDPAAIGDDTGTVEIKGNLTVQGTTTTINSTTVDLDNLALGDNEKFLIGDGGTGDNNVVGKDLEIYSDGSNIYFDSPYIYTGDAAVSPNIYFRTSAVTTLDTNALSILASGDVGIGTDNPVGSLEVRDSKANLIVAKNGLTVKSNSDLHTTYDTLQIGAGGALLSYSVATVTADTQFVHNAYRSSGGTFKYRYADTAARIRMNSPGGEIIFDNAASGSAGADITFSERLRITSSGNVGIGTDNPISFSGNADNPNNGVVLSVYGSSPAINLVTDTTTGYSLINFGRSGSGSNPYRAVVGYNQSNDDLALAAYSNITFITNGQISDTSNERLRITSTGNVGIGTTNPSEKLHIVGKFRLFDGGYPYIDMGVTTSNYFRLIHDNPNDRFYIGKNDNPTLVITGGNNVEPGADSSYNLGSPTSRWANIYSADLQLSNEGSPTGNEVDGTWGAYTIQEGEEALYLINRRSGKKFKFVLEEVK